MRGVPTKKGREKRRSEPSSSVLRTHREEVLDPQISET